MTNFRLASVNVNGIRAAYRKGMGDWLEHSGADIVALQEVRATTDQLTELTGSHWHVAHDESHQKGRAGVAILSRMPADTVRTRLPGENTDSAGRWLEADFTIDGTTVTVVSVYVHSGEVGTPRQESKWAFLEAMGTRLDELAAAHQLAAVVGDMNVGHCELDIKNWRGNRKKSGFLPQERAYFDRFFGARGKTITGVDGSTGTGHGWVDVGRTFAGQVDGPYTWWSKICHRSRVVQVSEEG